MTVELYALLVAAAVTIVTLATVVGLFAGIRSLERSRDELIELGLRR